MPRTNKPSAEAEAAFEAASAASNYHSALDDPIYYCYVCDMIIRAGKGKVISKRTRLAICHECDCDYVAPTVHKQEAIVNTAVVVSVSIDNAVCKICRFPIIDKRSLSARVRRRVNEKTSNADRKRIEESERQKGWRAIGNGEYVHNKCK